MQYKKFESIDIPLSVIGLGTWQYSGKNDWPNFDKDTAIKIIHKAIDSGINFIDTAPVYGLGYSEQVVGEALKGKRDKVFLATKVGLPWDENNNVRHDLTAKSILKEVDDSLRRLNADYIDLYQIHWPDPNTDIRETMEVLAKIKEQGKIRYIGVSNFSLELLKKAMEVTEVISHQGLYNMLEQNATLYHGTPLGYSVRNSLLPFLEENNQFFLPYSPLMQGLLAGKFNFEQGVRSNNPQLQGEILKENLEKAQKISEAINKPINEIALNWLIAQKTVGPIIAGCTKMHHLDSNLKALEWSLDDKSMDIIDEICSK